MRAAISSFRFRIDAAAVTHYSRPMELHILERAFELAKAGDCTSIDDIRRRLKAEKYSQVDAHLAGATVRRQLLDLCKEARGEGKA